MPGSPFRVKCYDPKKVIVTPPTTDSSVRKPTRFLSELRNDFFLFFISYFNSKFLLVDACRAGEGNLEISVNHSGRNIPNQVNSLGNSRFEVQFTPQEVAVHYCNILFNGEPVSGKPISLHVHNCLKDNEKKRKERYGSVCVCVYLCFSPFLYLNIHRMIDDCTQSCLAVFLYLEHKDERLECKERQVSLDIDRF